MLASKDRLTNRTHQRQKQARGPDAQQQHYRPEAENSHEEGGGLDPADSYKQLVPHPTPQERLKCKQQKCRIFRRHRKLSLHPWDREKCLKSDIMGQDPTVWKS